MLKTPKQLNIMNRLNINFIILFITVLFFSCSDIFNSDDEKINIIIYNYTKEDITIKYEYSGVKLSWIPKATSLELNVSLNTSLKAIGNQTNKDYGSQTFCINNEVWVIND